MSQDKSKTVISWNTKKVDNGFKWMVYTIDGNKPINVIETGVESSRAKAVTRAKKWMRFHKKKLKESETMDNKPSSSACACNNTVNEDIHKINTLVTDNATDIAKMSTLAKRNKFKQNKAGKSSIISWRRKLSNSSSYDVVDIYFDNKNLAVSFKRGYDGTVGGGDPLKDWTKQTAWAETFQAPLNEVEIKVYWPAGRGSNGIRKVGFNGTKWWWVSSNGLKNVHNSREKFRYALKNDANYPSRAVDTVIKKLEAGSLNEVKSFKVNADSLMNGGKNQLSPKSRAKLKTISGDVEIRIEPRNTSGMSGRQDKFMINVYYKGKQIFDIGSHPSERGAANMIKGWSNKANESLDEGKFYVDVDDIKRDSSSDVEKLAGRGAKTNLGWSGTGTVYFDNERDAIDFVGSAVDRGWKVSKAFRNESVNEASNVGTHTAEDIVILQVNKFKKAFQSIDSTHIGMNAMGKINKFFPIHIRQLDDKPYYNDLVKWLKTGSTKHFKKEYFTDGNAGKAARKNESVHLSETLLINEIAKMINVFDALDMKLDNPSLKNVATFLTRTGVSDKTAKKISVGYMAYKSGKVSKEKAASLLKEELSEVIGKFTKSHLDTLRKEYGKLNSINPSSNTYKKLIALLDKLPQENLKQMADAKPPIKFVSGLAKNRVKKNEAVNEVMGPKYFQRQSKELQSLLRGWKLHFNSNRNGDDFVLIDHPKLDNVYLTVSIVGSGPYTDTGKYTYSISIHDDSDPYPTEVVADIDWNKLKQRLKKEAGSILKGYLNESSADYTTFFNSMLKKHGVSSPDEFKSDEEKKKFFDKVDAEWDADNETDVDEATATGAVAAYQTPGAFTKKGDNKKKEDKLTKLAHGTFAKSIDEASQKKYDIGMSHRGNGLSVYNRNEEEHGDYKSVAHIANNGKVKYYDNKLPSNIKREIEKAAKDWKKNPSVDERVVSKTALKNLARAAAKVTSKKKTDNRYTHNFSLNINKGDIAQILIKFKPDYNESSEGADGTVDLELGFGSNSSKKPSFYRKLDAASNYLDYSVWDNETSNYTRNESTLTENQKLLDKIGDKLADMEERGKENTADYKKLAKAWKKLDKKLNESLNETVGENLAKIPNKFDYTKHRQGKFGPGFSIYGYKGRREYFVGSADTEKEAEAMATFLEKKGKKAFDAKYGQMAESIAEATYRAFKKDETMTSRQKVGTAIKEMNGLLYKMEQLIRQSTKLKTETGMEPSQYWKSTQIKLEKVTKRVVSVAKYLRELKKQSEVANEETVNENWLGGSSGSELFVGDTGIKKLVAISKKNSKALYIVTDDNYSNIGSFWLRNGKWAKVTCANPYYDFDNKAIRKMKSMKSVIFKYKDASKALNEGVRVDNVPTLKTIEAEMKKLDWSYEAGGGTGYRNGSAQHDKIRKMIVRYLDANPKDANKITSLSKKIEPNSYFIQHGSWVSNWKYGRR